MRKDRGIPSMASGNCFLQKQLQLWIQKAEVPSCLENRITEEDNCQVTRPAFLKSKRSCPSMHTVTTTGIQGGWWIMQRRSGCAVLFSNKNTSSNI